jgi:hypothetical protein
MTEEIPMSAITPTSTVGLELAGVELTELGAVVTGPIDQAAVVDALGRLSRNEAWTRWTVGDLFLALAAAADEELTDEPAGAGRAAAYVAVASLGFSASWLNQAIVVSERVPVGVRRVGLSWGHHRVVAVEDVPSADQGRWLGLAVANSWSVKQLEAAVDEWRRRDQDELDLGEPDAPPRIPPSALARIVEAAALASDGWVLVHPGDWAVRVPGQGS